MTQISTDGLYPVNSASPVISASSPAVFCDVLTAVAVRLNNATPEDQAAAISFAMESAAAYVGADNAHVYLNSHENDPARLVGISPDGSPADEPIARETLNIPLIAGGRKIGECRLTGIPGDRFQQHYASGELELFGALLAGFLLRIRCELAQKETIESMNLLFDSTHDAIGMLNSEYTILNVNREFARRFGKKPSELIGRNMDEFALTHESKNIFLRRRALFKKVLETGQPASLEDCRDGRWYDNRFFPVFQNDKAVAVTVLSTDITDRKNLEAEKEASIALRIQSAERQNREQEYLDILNSTTEGSFVVDFENGTTRYSDKWMQRLNLIGLPPSILLEQFFKKMDPEDVSAIRSDRNRAEEIKVPTFRREYRVTDKKGRTLWVLIQGKCIYNEEGRLVKTYGTFIDITERKELELALQQQADSLAEQNLLINNFFLNVSHEFRTPLSVLLMQLDMMDLHMEEAKCQFRDSVVKMNCEMRTNVYRLMHLVGNILDITKAEAGYDSPRLANIDIVPLAEEIVDAVRTCLSGTALRIQFLPNMASLIIPTDRDKLEKILLNLMSNAVKYSPSGGLVQVSIKKSGGCVLISVSDEGCGIPADMIDSIFNRFQQSDSLARTHEGCGIGLSLTKSLVELLGGHIYAKSRLGCGSRFCVELPSLPLACPSEHISQDSLSLLERVEIALSDVRTDITPTACLTAQS